jgi:DNA-binding NarL/FixJ family response regulator
MRTTTAGSPRSVKQGKPAPLPVRVISRGEGRESLVAEALELDGLPADVTAGPPGSRVSGRPGRAEVVITDVEHPADLREVIRVEPTARIVVLRPSVSATIARRLLEAGADGIVPETEARHALGPVVRAVLAGQVCVPKSSHVAVEPPALSTRERQVLALMASGLSNAEIAERLFLSESTVKSHAASAFRRLGVRSRREAVAMVLGSSETLRRTVLMSHPLETLQRTGDRRRSRHAGSPR